MPGVPYPLTGDSMEELRMQMYEILRQLYEEKIGGADLGDVFAIVGDILTLVLEESAPGLIKSGNKLAVLLVSDMGLAVGSNGIYVKLAEDGGLESTSSGLSILIDPVSNPTLSLSIDGIKIDPIGAYAQMNVVNTGDFAVDATHAYYFGDFDTNDSWRIIRSGTGLAFDRREGGVWVNKGSFAA